MCVRALSSVTTASFLSVKFPNLLCSVIFYFVVLFHGFSSFLTIL